MEIKYEEGQIIAFKGDVYVILQIICHENFIGLLCQRDSSTKVEMIELPKAY